MNLFEVDIYYKTHKNILEHKVMLFNVLEFGYQESINTKDQESFFKSLQKNHHYHGPLSVDTDLNSMTPWTNILQNGYPTT
jgi:hypothetical protein